MTPYGKDLQGDMNDSAVMLDAMRALALPAIHDVPYRDDSDPWRRSRGGGNNDIRGTRARHRKAAARSDRRRKIEKQTRKAQRR